MTNKNTPLVHRYFSRPEAFYVNSWIIEFNQGLVIIDSQFLISEAKGLVNKIREIGKPPIALLITHPHPDHYNGGAFIKTVFPQIEIISTPEKSILLMQAESKVGIQLNLHKELAHI